MKCKIPPIYVDGTKLQEIIKVVDSADSVMTK